MLGREASRRLSILVQWHVRDAVLTVSAKQTLRRSRRGKERSMRYEQRKMVPWERAVNDGGPVKATMQVQRLRYAFHPVVDGYSILVHQPLRLKINVIGLVDLQKRHEIGPGRIQTLSPMWTATYSMPLCRERASMVGSNVRERL